MLGQRTSGSRAAHKILIFGGNMSNPKVLLNAVLAVFLTLAYIPFTVTSQVGPDGEAGLHTTRTGGYIWTLHGPYNETV